MLRFVLISLCDRRRTTIWDLGHLGAPFPPSSFHPSPSSSSISFSLHSFFSFSCSSLLPLPSSSFLLPPPLFTSICPATPSVLPFLSLILCLLFVPSLLSWRRKVWAEGRVVMMRAAAGWLTASCRGNSVAHMSFLLFSFWSPFHYRFPSALFQFGSRIQRFLQQMALLTTCSEVVLLRSILKRNYALHMKVRRAIWKANCTTHAKRFASLRC